MTAVDLNSIPSKLVEGPRSAAQVLSYSELVSLVERLQTEDPRIVFDSLRPMGDELWNFVDGRRTIQEIADVVCFEFDFDLDPENFLGMFAALERDGLIAFKGRD